MVDARNARACSSAHPVVVHDDGIHLNHLPTLELREDWPFGVRGAVGEVSVAALPHKTSNELSVISTAAA